MVDGTTHGRKSGGGGGGGGGDVSPHDLEGGGHNIKMSPPQKKRGQFFGLLGCQRD